MDQILEASCPETIYGRFHMLAQAEPHATAVIASRGDGAADAYTRAELDEMACKVAAALPAGVRRVGIAMKHGVAQIAAILGVLKAGAAYVPVEPDFPAARIRYMMENAQVDRVITDEGLEVFAPCSDSAANASTEPPIAFTADALDCSTDIPSEDDLAYILYTSGTTGKPKGVQITNANVCNYVDAFCAEFHPTSADVMLQYSVCSFDIFVEEVFSALLSGMTLAIPSAAERTSIPELMKFVQRNNVSIISGFPYLIQELNELPELPFSLRLLISGGDVLRERYVDHLLDLVDIYNTYGPSETTVCASYCHCNTTPALPDGTFPVGSPVRGVQVRIMDDALEEVPAGEVGEIVILGRGVGLGYAGDPPEQANFVTLPAVAGDEQRAHPENEEGATRHAPGASCKLAVDEQRAYRSGDLGYLLPDGQIAFMHRKDTQVMIDGRRVEPTEVESVLCTCPEVETGVVRSGVDADQMPYLVGYYVPAAEDHDPQPAASTEGRPAVAPAIPADDAAMETLLREEMSQYLAPYMVPEYFVRMDALPLTPNGKVDTHALPQVETA